MIPAGRQCEEPDSRATGQPAAAPPSQARTYWRRTYATFWRWVGAPILGSIIGLILVVRITGFWSGPGSYVIYFVGKTSEPAVKQMSDGIREQLGGQGLAVDGKSVILDDRNDFGDPGRAKEIARDLADRSDTLLIIGHGYSSTSKQALPVYLAADQPIPVILPTETNPALLPPTSQFLPVYRLAPTDEVQAKVAALYAMDKLQATAFWVISDPGNQVYSEYLASEFTRQVHQIPGHLVVLTTSAGPAFPPDFPNRLGVRCVFFAGDWSPALTIVRQVRSSLPAVPIILSDGAATQQILKQGGSVINGTYVLHPRKAEEIEKDGYKTCGRDAAFIGANIIKEANQRFDEIREKHSRWTHLFKWALNIHSVSDARAVIRQVMEDRAYPKRDPFDSPSGQQYHFNTRGEPERLNFQVWKVDQQHFVTP
jgi:hypothetical protein